MAALKKLLTDIALGLSATNGVRAFSAVYDSVQAENSFPINHGPRSACSTYPAACSAENNTILI